MPFNSGGIIRDPATGNAARVNSDGQLHVVLEGKVDVGNSTETPLLAEAVFTGVGIDVSAYSAITILVNSDVASDVGGLVAQFSADGIDWHDGEAYTIEAGSTKFFTPPVQAKFFRLIYTNDVSDQTVFHLHVMLKKSPVKWSSHNIDMPIADQDDAELVKAVITGKKVNGEYDNVSLTNGANMKVSLEELESGVSSNANSQLNVTPFHADGTEGILITGLDYVDGKSGIDASTEAIETIAYEHHEIHSGSHFYICDFDDLDTSDTVDFAITTPDTTKWTHIIFEIAGTSKTEFYVYEDATVTGGTSTVPLNNNRNSANASGTVLVKNPTVNVLGAEIFSQSRGRAGTTPNAATSEGIVNRSNELVLKQNTTYIFRIVSGDDDNTVSYCGEWYEHTNKN